MHNNLKNKSGIYIIKNTINNKVYIGSAVNIYNRIYEHLRTLKHNEHRNKYLQNHYSKYSDSFYFEIICFCDKEDLIIKEQFYIDFYQSFIRSKGFNINKIANNMFGFRHSDKTKLNWSKKRKGVKFSEEAKKNMSKAKQGSNHSRAKLNETDVLNIRSIHDGSRQASKILSTKYQVSWTTIHYIIIKKTWKHI